MIPGGTALASVGAITGERSIPDSVAEHAAECQAGVPETIVGSGQGVPVILEAPGAESLRCLVARLSTDPGLTRSYVDRLECGAPDRTVDLRCELHLTLQGQRPPAGRDNTLYGILVAVVASQLDIDRLAILPDRIELGGVLPSEKARTDLEAAAGKSGIPVRSFGMTVKPALTAATMPVLAKGSGTAQLHMAGLPAAAALALTGDPARPFVAIAGANPLTGRVAGANRAAIARALAGAHPVSSVPIAATGKGRKVDLSFQSVEASHLVGVLADVQGVSAAVPRDAKPLAIYTKSMPADSVLAAVAKLLGLAQVRQGTTVFLVPAGTKLRAPGAKEALRTLQVEGATAAEALSLVVADLPITFCLPAGKPLRAMLRNAAGTTLAEALRVIDGGEPTDAASCVRAPFLAIDRMDELDGLRVIATMTGGGGAAKARALVRTKTGSVAILDGPPALSVTSSGVSWKASEDPVRFPFVDARDVRDAPLADHRLIATLVSPQGSFAVLEGRRGRVRVVQGVWTQESGVIEVFPGSLKMTIESYDAYGYRTRASTELLLRP